MRNGSQAQKKKKHNFFSLKILLLFNFSDSPHSDKVADIMGNLIHCCSFHTRKSYLKIAIILTHIITFVSILCIHRFASEKKIRVSQLSPAEKKNKKERNENLKKKQFTEVYYGPATVHSAYWPHQTQYAI